MKNHKSDDHKNSTQLLASLSPIVSPHRQHSKARFPIQRHELINCYQAKIRLGVEKKDDKEWKRGREGYHSCLFHLLHTPVLCGYLTLHHGETLQSWEESAMTEGQWGHHIPTILQEKASLLSHPYNSQVKGQGCRCLINALENIWSLLMIETELGISLITSSCTTQFNKQMHSPRIPMIHTQLPFCSACTKNFMVWQQTKQYDISHVKFLL